MPTLLLADDSLTTQKVVDLTFADEGIKVVTADDGDTALELFDHHKPDIVLADVNIPGLNGYEVCEKIRNREGADSTPVILLVGSFEPFDADEAHRVGANDYLTKPFSSIRRLVATVTALLDKPATAAAMSNGEEFAAAEETKLDEPDMTSTSDIEQLYSESFAETVEMPHTIAEREIYGVSDLGSVSVPTGSQSEPEAIATELNTEGPVKRDDLAFDDELIEMHLADEPAQAETEIQSLPEVEETAATVEEIPAVEQIVEEAADGNLEAGHEQEGAGAGIAPIDDGPHAPGPEPAVEDAATERFSLDELREEAYFEPAAEPISEESQPTEEYAVEQHDIPAGPGPTPWDSIAEPAERKFELDEANLLELPGSSSVSGSNSDAGHSQLAAISSEVVEQIARETASQISEELVREIAERIVPKVVEQVIARQTGEKADR